MKHLTILTTLALACSALGGCDRQQELPHENAVPERSPTNVVDKTTEGSPTLAPSDGTIHQAKPEAADQALVEGKEREAEADLEPAKGQKLDGDIELKETADGVHIIAEIEDASPGMHGFHIHEKGDCSDIAGKSMGGHFNPGGKAHMLPHEGDERHLGDLGNIEVGTDGKGKVTFTLPGATLKEGDAHSLLGKSFVVHEGKDVGQGKQPAGDSGPPIACGVIEKD